LQKFVSLRPLHSEDLIAFLGLNEVWLLELFIPLDIAVIVTITIILKTLAISTIETINGEHVEISTPLVEESSAIGREDDE